MIMDFVAGGFKVRCLYCKTFNIVYPQDPEYNHPLLQKMVFYQCSNALLVDSGYFWDKNHNRV